MALVAALSLVACGGGGSAADSSQNGSSCVNDGPTVYYAASAVPLLTTAQVTSLRDEDIAALGANFKLLSNSALSALQGTVSQPSLFCKHRVSQIRAITADQVSSLTPQQVRFLGANSGGGIAQIKWLSVEAFKGLMSDPAQVTAMTAAEYGILFGSSFTQVGANFHYLSDSVLAVMKETFIHTTETSTSHLASITPEQVDALTTTQLRLLGTADGGPPKLQFLTDETYRKAMSKRENVVLLTAVDAANMGARQTANLGANLPFLSDVALQALKGTFVSNPTTTTSAVGGITPAQIALLSPAQILILTSINNGKGLGSLDELTFGALLPTQTAVFSPSHVVAVQAAQLAQLAPAAIAAMPIETRRSFTNLQKLKLTPLQLEYFK